MTVKVAVSGVPRGLQNPRPDGNWLTEEHKDRIRGVSREVELVEVPVQKVRSAGGFQVVLAEGGNRTHYPGELDWEDYQRFFTPGLRWIQLCSTGFSDNITPEVLDGTVTLTNSPGLHTVPIAESVAAAMLNHAKRLGQRRVDQANRAWRQLGCDELQGGTVLLIGVGNIGSRVASICKALGMKVIGTRRRPEPLYNVDLIFPASELRTHFGEADYVVVAAPLTPETENLLGEPEFRAMKSTAYFINVARGRIVHEPSLVKALTEHWIAGAYLDAFETEPLPRESPLWALDNVFLVPHDSHSSPHIGDRVVEIFAENLDRYVRGEPLLHVCDPRRGY